MSETTTGGMRRGAALMASGTAVSRVLGLLRGLVLVAAIAATGEAANAFSVANKLPNILYMLLAGGVLNAVLVPQVVRAYRRDAGQEYVDRLLTLGFAILAVVTVVLTAAAPLLVQLYTKGGTQAQIDLAVTFAYWCVPQLFFYGAYALLGQVLNARGSFGPYMWAPVVNNVVSIAGFFVFIAVFGGFDDSGLTAAAAWGPGQVALLAGSATLGVVAQALVLLPAMRRAGVHVRFRWGLRGSGLGRAGTVATWTFVGLGIGQLAFLVVSRAAWAAEHASGSTGIVAGNAAYDSAFLIFMLPHSLVTVSLATALFTRLSQQAHDADVDGVRASMSYGLRVVGLFTIIATAVIAVLAVPVTRIVVLTDPASVDAIAGVVLAMIVGLPFFGAWSLSQRTYYAYEDAKGMVPIQVAMAVVVVGGTLLGQALLPPSAWVACAGASMSASYALGALVSQWHLRRRLGTVDGPRVVRTHARALVAALVAVGVGLLTLRVLQSALSGGVMAAVVECLVVGGLMSAVYVGGLKVLRVAELDGLLGPVIGRLRAGRR
ncbi:murein biosynthesis integral membrane protein MurJ [Cellulomonas sp.]|uniref:murein biosynthesis integral membrane protein MurJ n=1 Tax=Cellulomonas sp. TaxID=40001 RepID=UPI001B0EB14F|nr:murein biosynthesis integral membrane protein MurJ [Cellulomonas sp.]MBO9556499.1 murein biosynthesis integral membrane protein MurJ [Cellulomonas sp.]